MVCHLSLKEMTSSLPLAKYCMSSSSRIAYLRLLVIQPPCLLTQLWRQESIGRGWSPSMKTFCQPDEGGAKEEAMFEPIISIGLGSDSGSQMTKCTIVGAERGPEGTSVGCSVASEVSRNLLRLRGAGGRGACCWEADCPKGRKWLPVIFLLTTILTDDPSDSVPSDKESMGSTTTGPSTRFVAAGSSTGIFSARPWNTWLAEPSLAVSSDPSLTCRGPSWRASPSVKPLGRKLWRQTLM